MQAVQGLWYGAWSIGGFLPRSLRAVYLHLFGSIPQTVPDSYDHLVVLAHGTAGFPELWAPLIDQLNLPNAAIIAPQFDTDGVDALDLAADTMKAQLEQIPRRVKITWVGHSWGGILGAHLVTERSVRIDHLILISSRCAVTGVRYNIWHRFLRDQGVFANTRTVLEKLEKATWPVVKVSLIYDPYDWLVPEGAFGIIGTQYTVKTLEGCGHLGTLFSSSHIVAELLQ